MLLNAGIVSSSVTSFLSDPFLANVVLHLKFDGTNGSTTFVDSSPNPKTVTRQGTQPPTISTAQSKLGGSSGLFGDANSYLSINDANLSLGTGAFTVELWGYKTRQSNDGAFSMGTSVSNFGINGLQVFSGNVNFQSVNTGDVFPLNQWNHLAVVREGTGTNQTKIYLNGTLIHTMTFSTNITQTFLHVGILSGVSYCWDGWIDSFRVTKGVARYTANFNPETDTFLN